MKTDIYFKHSVLTLALLCPQILSSQIWTGAGGNGNWGNASNWSPTAVPISGASVTFSGTVQLVVDLQTNRIVNALTFDAAAGAFSLNNNILTPTSIQNNSSNTQTINSTITLSGDRTFTAGTAPIVYNTINLSDSVTSRTLTMTGTSNHIVTGAITNGASTASNLTKTGSGTLILQAASSYSGNTTLTGGRLAVGHNNALGTSTLILNGGTLAAHATAITLANNATLNANSTIAGTHALTLSGTMTVNATRALIVNNTAPTTIHNVNLFGNLTTTGTGNLTLSGTTILNSNRILTNDLPSLTINRIDLSNSITNRTLTIAGSGTTNVIGSITNGASTASNLVKIGTGHLIFSGSTANTYTGTTSISGGTLTLAKTSGVNSIAGNINVAATGTLLLGQSHQISSTSNMTLSGGTFGTQGYSESLGMLTLTATSVIDFGHGSSHLHFADSMSAVWTSGTQLKILNWSGNLSGGGTDRLFFGTSSSGLCPDYVAQIFFINPLGLPTGTYGAKILATGEVVPVPEPGAWLAALFLFVIIVRQHLLSLKRKVD